MIVFWMESPKSSLQAGPMFHRAPRFSSHSLRQAALRQPCSAWLQLILGLSMSNIPSLLLKEELEKALPKGSRFVIHHVSTPPTPCDAIFSAPPFEKPEQTFRETHFLSVSIGQDGDEIQVFALEVLIYTTKRLTTIFVSKADSTGYLHLLQLPEGTPSTLKTISSTFLRYLVRHRQRPNTRLVLTLFGKAAHEYLFPASSYNLQKHRLEDRALIRWWCQVFDDVLVPWEPQTLDVEDLGAPTFRRDGLSVSARGFLRVPGCDHAETAHFTPRPQTSITGLQKQRWTVGDPLRELAGDQGIPERCIVPRFPDDPKSRMLIDLDDEIQDTEKEGKWRSVRNMADFWEVMSHRRECASGRRVGFLWVVFEPSGVNDPLAPDNELPEQATTDGPGTQTTSKSEQASSPASRAESRFDATQDLETQTTLPSSIPEPLLESEIQESITSPPGAESSQSHSPRKKGLTEKVMALDDIPHETQDYYWPVAGRGFKVVSQKEYNRAYRVLQKGEFEPQEKARESSRAWFNALSDAPWGQQIEGQKEIVLTTGASASEEPQAVMMNMSLIKKKKRKRSITADVDSTNQSSNEGKEAKIPRHPETGELLVDH